jgi:hypothetical protein
MSVKCPPKKVAARLASEGVKKSPVRNQGHALAKYAQHLSNR